ncbi:murein DD-endopeptidase MepM/ murein hydrolase activator NlpD [Cryobacterium sp. CAN_C3]|uniref:M23 family metallopeptidase n=1 Tax=unclassified Cryobacterium TaxID=2649013 RepID=UPI0018C97A2C|nr:M23 family metallopeptidase [Cryobacterium sp. CAN_C3]MEC5156003.1 murein DD-endopeptidase MepM/ murein hydrolase activator NlpD [Cryobacterium sp. CAN_C3]
MGTSVSGESDGTVFPPVAPAALTRRQLRERERVAFSAAAPVDEVVVDIVRLSPAADLIVAADLSERDLEPAVVTETNRIVAAVPVADAEPTDYEKLLAPGITQSIPTVIPPAGGLPRRRQRIEQKPGEPFAPARDFVPAGSLPRRTPRARPPGSTMRKRAARGASILAMSFVALMAVATSIPAEALLSSQDVQASALEAQRVVPAEEAQSMDLAGGDTVTVERDGYESSTIAEVAAASGIRMEDTFTNNPNGTIQWPFAVGVHIGDQMGHRNCAGCSVNHGGQDFNPGVGAPIQAIADGVVSRAEDGEASLGVHMMIDHMVNGELVTSVYAHMIHGSMLFKEGDVVKVGQVIGKTGSTGMSTGPHLHFEIREGGITGTKVDPLAWLYANTN